MELFDKKFVHFMWDDELKGKRGFLSSGIASLIKMVNEDSDRTEIQKGCERDFPFCKHITEECRFAYYDPNYEVKWAYYKEGKKVQCKSCGEWVDCDTYPLWEDDCQYRIKPEVKIAYVHKGVGGYSIDGFIDGSIYQGTIAECMKWIEGHEKKCPCAGCPQDEGRKDQSEMKRETYYVTKYADGFRVTPFKALGARFSGTKLECEDYVKYQEMKNEGAFTQKKITYRPFKDCDELVEFWSKNYQTVMRPAHTKPFIWVRLKVDKRERLIVAFGTGFVEIGNKAKAVTLQKLFEDYEFLDGAVCGVKND